MSQSLPNHQQVGAAPIGAIRQASIPIRDSGIISGDKDQYGKPRRQTRSESQSSGPEEECASISMARGGSYGQSPILQGMQAEGIWQHRSSFEHAESNYQRWLASDNGQLSASPKSPNSRGVWSSQTRRPRGQLQSQGQPVATVKASGTPHGQSVRGRSRTSSETERGNKGSRGPTPRKRDFFEMEPRLVWDKYGTFTQGMGES